MKNVIFATVTIVSTVLLLVINNHMVTADEETVPDKIKSYFDSVHNNYKEEIDSVKKSVDDIKEKATQTFNSENFNLEKKIDSIMSVFREKRSAQTYPESAKSPADEALEKVNSAYNDLRDKVSSFFGNVSNSEVYSDVKSHLDKFKNTLQDAGTHIKSTLHNITAPTSSNNEESKESKESH